MPVNVLDREIFSEAEAARLLRVAQGTLNYWLNGGKRRGRTYAPIIRPEPSEDRVVPWAEFVEAGLLRQYRRALQVPMVEVRLFVDELRNRLGIPYLSRTLTRSSARVSASFAKRRSTQLLRPSSA